MHGSFTRRTFLKTTLAAGMGVTAGRVGAAPNAPTTGGDIMSVAGPAPASSLGWVLPHEHVTTDFLGAEKLPAPRYDRDLAQRQIQPHLEELRSRKVSALIECTPTYIGRDVRLLKQLSEATGLLILTNTGYYGAVNNKFLPRHAYTETSEQLAARWIAEWRDGIENTGIRPGFVKLGTGSGKLPELHTKLVRAACRTHRETGLTLAIHTGDGEAARDELRILREERIAPSALVWVHAQNDPGPIQLELARLGAWISLDGYSLAARNPERYRNFLVAHRDAGTLNRVLVSHDDGWAVEGDQAKNSGLKLFENGNPRPYRSIFERLIPELSQDGFKPEEVDRLFHINPAEAFTIRKRLA